MAATGPRLGHLPELFLNISILSRYLLHHNGFTVIIVYTPQLFAWFFFWDTFLLYCVYYSHLLQEADLQYPGPLQSPIVDETSEYILQVETPPRPVLNMSYHENTNSTVSNM